MTWFKVDDQLHGDPKVRKAGAAMALWVVAGAWCAAYLTDGSISSRDVLILFPTVGTRYARTLVKVGLWEAVDLDGEPGYHFHNWDKWQPSREEEQAKRKRNAEKQAAFRARVKEGRNPGSNRLRNPVTTPVIPPVHNPVSNQDPTRPSPLRGERGGEGAPAPQAARPHPTPDTPSWLDDPTQLAAHHNEVAAAAEAATHAIAAERQRAHNGAALARAALPPKRPTTDRTNALDQLRALTTDANPQALAEPEP